MTLAAYMFISVFVSVLMELLLGNFGLIIPFTACAVFYFTVSSGGSAGLICASLAGTAIDSILCRPFPLTAVLLIAVSAIASLWLNRVDTKSMILHLIPGALLALIYTIPLLSAASIGMGLSLYSLIRDFSTFVISLAISSVLLPMLIMLLDSFSEKLELDLYRDAREKLFNRNQQ